MWRGSPDQSHSIFGRVAFSSVLVEADLVSLFSETSSADHELVLSNETVSVVTNSASS